jgi:tetratricopeptide (TPR) repeat protein
MKSQESVFISYRATNFYTALAVYQSLAQHGLDVFMRFQKGHDLEDVSEAELKRRGHFIAIISPSALEAYQEAENPLRREAELALASGRNVIPLVMEGFDSSNPSVQRAISGKMAKLKEFSALRLYSEYFFAGLEKLRERCMNSAVNEEAIGDLSAKLAKKSAEEQAAAASAPPVQMKELITEEWFERGVAAAQHGIWRDAIHAFTEALKARPSYAQAYHRRGVARHHQGDFEGAIGDFDETLHYQPGYAGAYLGRGKVHSDEGKLKRALDDFDKALDIEPDFAEAYYQRGKTNGKRGDVKRALADYDEAIRINPNFAEAYNDRGIERYNRDDFGGALDDYNAALQINPGFADAHNSRGLVRGIQGDLDGAIVDFSEALFIQPDYAAAYYNRATIWQRKKAYRSAITDYRKYLNLSQGMLYGNQEKVKGIIRDLMKKL